MIDIVGLKLKKVSKESEYYELSDIQKKFYDEAEKEFEIVKERIQKAKNKSDLAKVRDRSINKSEVARRVSKYFGRNLNHSHMSKQNCSYLYEKIGQWNLKLQAFFDSSDLVSLAHKSKEELKKEVGHLNGVIASEQRELSIKRIEFIANALLLPEQAEMKNKIARLETENRILNEKLANLEIQRLGLLEQLTSEVEIQRVKQQNIRLRTLLEDHGIKPDF